MPTVAVNSLKRKITWQSQGTNCFSNAKFRGHAKIAGSRKNMHRQSAMVAFQLRVRLTSLNALASLTMNWTSLDRILSKNSNSCNPDKICRPGRGNYWSIALNIPMLLGLKRRRNYVNRSASYKRQTRKTQIKESTKYWYKIAGKFVALAIVILGVR